MFERLLEQPPYSLKQSEKEPLLLQGLNELTRYHYEKSPEYKRIIDAAWGGLETYRAIAEVPWLPVSLFKEMELKSTNLPAMVMRSSGTTGQRTSRIVIDNETARRQSEALVASFRPILGSRRLPFLAIDTKDVIKPTDLTARGGGVLGMMKFGAKTAFALNSQLDLDKDIRREFRSRERRRAVPHFRLHLSRLGQALSGLRRWRARPLERNPHSLRGMEKARGAKGLQRRVPGRAQAPVQPHEHFQLLWLRRADRLGLHRRPGRVALSAQLHRHHREKAA